MPKNKPSKVTAALGCGLALAGVVSSAHGQVDTNAPTKLKKIVVTGSNIPTAETVPPVPVDVYTAEQIQKTGATTINQLTKPLPSFIGNGNFGESRGNGGNGQATIALRGIGGGTLILLNGRRFANGDLNSIPVAAIERIEVLKDGGSAIYGADAVAGVVNIILKKDYNGTELSAYYGNTTQTDVGSKSFSFVTGVSNEKTSLLVGASYYDANALYSVDRDRSDPRQAVPSFANTSGSSSPGRIRSSDPAAVAAFPGLSNGLIYTGPPGTFATAPTTTGPGAQFRPYNTSTPLYPDRFPFPIYTPAITPNNRYSIFGNIDQKLFGESLSFFSEAMYTRTYNYNQLAPVPAPFNSLTPPVIVPANNPFNVFGVPLNRVRMRFTELGPRTDENFGDIFRFLAGLKGRIGETSWNWEAALLWSEDRRVEKEGSDVNTTALQAAVNDTNPATSFNVFGNGFGANYNTKAALDRIRQDLFINTKNTLYLIDLKAGGELFNLPAGPVSLVLGYEHREEFTSTEPDAAVKAGLTVGFNQADPFSASRYVDGGYGEVSIPITSPDNSIPGAYSLRVVGAGRVEQYSDFGNVRVPKVTLRWQPIDESLTVRASYSESFQAPSFTQLYSSGANFVVLNNPFKPESDSSKYDQIEVDVKANPNLKAQTSKNYTAGIIYTPPFIKRLTVSADYYRIEESNVVGGSPQSILDANARTGGPLGGGLFASQIRGFDPASGDIDHIDFALINASRRLIQGVDLSLIYEQPLTDWGKLTFAADAAYVLTFKDEIAPGAGFRDHLGDFNSDDSFGYGSIPRLKGKASAYWEYKGLTLGSTVNYIDAYLDDINKRGGNREIKAMITLDVQASYEFRNTSNKYINNTKFTVGVLNVTDEAPPLAVGAFADNYDRDTHDLRGRFVYASLTKKF